MTDNIKIDINSGVHANVGFDFQRHSCIYIFLEKYNELKNLNYFIMLEHYDDIIFGILNQHSELKSLHTFQAKKSSSEWTNARLYEILKKIMNVGIETAKDNLTKSHDYLQNHYFVTNNTININYKNKSSKKNYLVNETNEQVCIDTLDDEIKNSLLKGNKKISYTTDELSFLKNIHFRFIDLGRNSDSQKNLLVGKFQEVFKDAIVDHRAALDTLVLHLQKIETKYNQGDKLFLEDKHKRIEASTINEIINILTTNKLAIEFCRKNAKEIFKILRITIFDQEIFLLEYENSLDRFKDLTQSEHKKIFNYIEKNKILILNQIELLDSIDLIYQKYIADNTPILSEIHLKAAISAACFLITKM